MFLEGTRRNELAQASEQFSSDPDPGETPGLQLLLRQPRRHEERLLAHLHLKRIKGMKHNLGEQSEHVKLGSKSQFGFVQQTQSACKTEILDSEALAPMSALGVRMRRTTRVTHLALRATADRANQDTCNGNQTVKQFFVSTNFFPEWRIYSIFCGTFSPNVPLSPFSETKDVPCWPQPVELFVVVLHAESRPGGWGDPDSPSQSLFLRIRPSPTPLPPQGDFGLCSTKSWIQTWAEACSGDTICHHPSEHACGNICSRTGAG